MNVTSKIPFTAATSRKLESEQPRILPRQEMNNPYRDLKSVHEVPASRVNSRPAVLVPEQQPQPKKGLFYGVDPTTPIFIR